jgi:hypothetical protein
MSTARHCPTRFGLIRPSPAATAHLAAPTLAATLTVRCAGHEEVIEVGDAFYMPPGHVPAADAGSEFVQFTPSDELRVSEAANVYAGRAHGGGRVIPSGAGPRYAELARRFSAVSAWFQPWLPAWGGCDGG